MKIASELVTFYPTYGFIQDNVWQVHMKIWVREPARGIRKLLAKQVSKLIRNQAELKYLDESKYKMFMLRAENFIADNESFEKVEFQFDHDPQQFTYHVKDSTGGSRTDFNGLQHGTLKFSTERAQELLTAQNSKQGWLTFRAVSDDHVGQGQLRLINPKGHSIISDIDDTIKVTDISKGRAVVLMNTFFKNFVAAPDMLDKYQNYGPETAFHYVSGGPWQMYEPLAKFLFNQGVGFPDGSIHMKNVRLNLFTKNSYKDLWQLISKGSEATIDQKKRQIAHILNDFPKRTFTLVGDSGEHDPEIFKAIQSQHPHQIDKIYIRDVANDAINNPERLSGLEVIKVSPVNLN